MNDGKQREASPSVSQKSVSDDDEIDYSTKPEFYDSDLDDKDESWVRKKRGGRTSDAILSCPACFTTLCLDCQSDAILMLTQNGFFSAKLKTSQSLSNLLLRKTKNFTIFIKSSSPYVVAKRRGREARSPLTAIDLLQSPEIEGRRSSATVGLLEESSIEAIKALKLLKEASMEMRSNAER
nr:E2F-associated phosphoprotein [Ipomoea batatas]